MISRRMRITARIAAGLGAVVFATSVACANSTPAKALAGNSAAQTKFQKDLESLLGAAIKTKHGEMSLRQSKDENGRVRKQILAGSNYSEVQLDQNGDGTVDYWSVTQGQKSVVASEPNRGRFLRLVISDRSPSGLVESTYLLNLNGRAYSLLKTRIVGNDVGFRSESRPRFEATDIMRRDDESARVRRLLDSGGDPAAIPAASVPKVGDERFSLVEADWTKQQNTVFGEDLVCLPTDNGYGRLARLQREWWSVLKFEVEEKTDRLAQKLKASPMFADTCKTKANAEEFDRLAKSLSQVMLSSAKGEVWESKTSRGRYLRCLEQSGLGITAAEIERGFLNNLNDSYRRSFAPITCEIKSGAASLSVPAKAFPARQQIAVYMAAENEGKWVDQADGSEANYPNVLFHELIHLTGIEDEGIVHAAQACCGDPSESRGAACNKLDLLVTKAARAKSIETFLSRSANELVPLTAQLEATFGRDDANKIYASFLEGLDDFKKGSPPQGTYVDGLLSSAEFSRCMDKSTASVCRAQWTREISAYADRFFSKECRLVASGANRKNCKNMSDTFKGQLAQAISASLIDTTTSSGGQCVARTSAQSTGEKDGALRAVQKIFGTIFGFEALAADNVECATFDVPTAPVVTPVVCVNNECGPPVNTVTNVDGHDAPGKHISVPGEARSGDAARTDERVSGSAGSGGPGVGSGGGRVTASPLPVQQVDNVADSRPFAEDQYRRATDFVGGATRQFDKVRDAILPRAEAGDRSSRSDVSRDQKLGLKDAFVAFRPGEGKSVVRTVDNPFAEKRMMASIADLSNGGQKNVAPKNINQNSAAGGLSSASSAATPAALSAGTTTRGAGSATKPTTAASDSRAAVASRDSGSAAGTMADGSSTAKSRSTASVQKNSQNVDGRKGKVAVLDGLFSRPYREIEDRLNRLEVVEELISSKIAIQDANGRKLGSNRAKERYVFAGFDKPLQRVKD